MLTQHNTAAQCSSEASLSPHGCFPSFGAGREPGFPRAKGYLQEDNADGTISSAQLLSAWLTIAL